MVERLPVDIAVVGSANIDLSVRVSRLPVPGETVIGGDALRGGGGKGANQAVAAARLGAQVALIGRVGDDDAGRWLRGQLEHDGVDVRALLATPDCSTGLAMITVDDRAENSIVVSPGANARVSIGDLDNASQLLQQAQVVLAQLEIPAEVVAALPSRSSGRAILNPAPWSSQTNLSGFDVVLPNRGELAMMAGGEETVDLAVIADQAQSLDVAIVVVTLGPQGAMVVVNEAEKAATPVQVTTLPAAPVTAVDTTAAGDSFCGAFATALVEGATVVDAAAWAVRVAGQTVTARGAQSSLPLRTEVDTWVSH